MTQYSGMWTPEKGIGGDEKSSSPRSAYDGMWTPERGIGESPKPSEVAESLPANRYFSTQFDAYRRHQEQLAWTEQWNTRFGPRETVEKFFVPGSDREGVCVIYEVPDSRHPLVYVTSHPAELDGAPVAWCHTCQNRECTGCIFALKSYRQMSKVNGILRRGDDNDGLPF